jgi:hypothetical protein
MLILYQVESDQQKLNGYLIYIFKYDSHKLYSLEFRGLFIQIKCSRANLSLKTQEFGTPKSLPLCIFQGKKSLTH